MKNNKGFSIISFILTILILILLVFIFYEVYYVDIFEIMNKESSVNDNRIYKQNVIGYINTNSLQNIETIEPIIDNNFQTAESLISYKYYYNQLDEYGKIIYDGFEKNKENMKNGTYKIDFDTEFNDLLNTEGGDETLNIAFQSAWNAFTYDNMDIFYIDVEKLTLTTKTTSILGFSTHNVELSNGKNSNYLKDNFTNYQKIQSTINQLESFRDKMLEDIQGYSQSEKIKYVHNWMIENIEYDNYFEAEEPYSIVGALTEGKAVCEGYARGFKYIMDELAIPCILVSGTGTNSNGDTESHAWNYVYINEKWYAIDVTWDDPIIIGSGTVSSDFKYKHFLKGSNTFFTSHQEDGYLSENSIFFEFPKLSRDDY